jgi:hypothetical protein
MRGYRYHVAATRECGVLLVHQRGVDCPLSTGPARAGRAKNPPARDGHPLASRWVPILLALEIAAPRGPTKNARRHSPAHSRDESRQPIVGSATHPRRAAQARHRCWPDHSGKVHGEEKAATVAGLEDIPSQPCGCHCIDGHACRPDDLVSALIWTCDPVPFAPRASMAGRDLTSGCGMDCPEVDRSLRLVQGAAIPRSCSDVRRFGTSHTIFSARPGS